MFSFSVSQMVLNDGRKSLGQTDIEKQQTKGHHKAVMAILNQELLSTNFRSVSGDNINPRLVYSSFAIVCYETLSINGIIDP